MFDTKLCIDCKYCKKHYYDNPTKVYAYHDNFIINYRCQRRHGTSLVTGEPTLSTLLCEAERANTYLCGPQAQFFEAKE